MNEQQMRQMMEQMRKEMEAQYNQRLADVRLELKDPYQYRRQQEIKRGMEQWGEVSEMLRKHYQKGQPQPSQTTPQPTQPPQKKPTIQDLQNLPKKLNNAIKRKKQQQQPSQTSPQPSQTPTPQPNQPPTASEPIVSTPVIRGSEPMVSIPPMRGTTPSALNYDDFFQQYGGMMGSFGNPPLKRTQNPLLDAFRAGLINRPFGG